MATKFYRRLAISFGAAFLSGQVVAQTFDLERHETETLETSADMISWGGMGGVAVDREGYIWQSNFGEYLWRIHPKSGEVKEFADGFLSASGNAALPGGDILQAEFATGRIWKIDRFKAGERTLFSDEGLSGPVGVAVLRDRGVFVANCFAGNIARIPLEGGAAEVFATHELFNCPNGVTADPDGNLYIVNNQDTYVFKITPEGETTVFAHLPGVGHGHIAYAQGALYIAQLWNHKIIRLEMNGDHKVVAGDGRPGLKDGHDKAASVTHPNGLASASGGSVLIHNNIDGPMMVGDRARLVIRKTYLPSLSRSIRKAFEAGGVRRMLAVYDQHAGAPGAANQVSSAATILLQQGPP